MKRVLVVDDILENRYLLEALLKGYRYEVMSALNGAEALELARSSPPDIVIADILMPVMDGYALCREWKGDPVLRDIPFVIYTATYTEPEDRDFALSLGAERFVVKPQEPELLAGIIAEVLNGRPAETPRGAAYPERTPDDRFLREYNRALIRKLEKKAGDVDRLSRSLAEEIDERKRLETLVGDGETMLNSLLDAAPDAMMLTDYRGRLLYVNKSFVNLFGFGPEDLPSVDTWFTLAYIDVFFRRSMVQAWQNAADATCRGTTDIVPVEARVRCRDGSYRHVSVADAVVNGIHLTTYHDLTERKELESQLLQAQKMETVGHLAGGLAHDFNNILTAIVGYGHLLATKLPENTPTRDYAEQILNVSDRAAKLTQSIFAFSRKQKMEKKPVKLGRVVQDAGNILRRLVREAVELKMEPPSEDVAIMADPGQLVQILMNLVTNACDAIDGSGSITIEVKRALPDDEVPEAAGASPEEACALLTVSDTGQGMDEETRSKIFQPFFTTKESGKGTGLGLSVVFGIVRNHNGHISVRSDPGKGTAFDIFLPALKICDENEKLGKGYQVSGGNESILVAEDNEYSLRATAINLKEQGYEVIKARDGEQAVSMLKSRGDAVPLVIIDLVMPKMGGWEAYVEALRINPAVKVIFMSGYTDECEVTRMIRDKGLVLLSKPVPPALLLTRIRELLDDAH